MAMDGDDGNGWRQAAAFVWMMKMMKIQATAGLVRPEETCKA